MLISTTIKRYLRRHKRIILINLALIILITVGGYLGYLNHRVNVNNNNQKVIVSYLQKNSIEQETEKIKTHAIAIRQKIDGYNPVGNKVIDSEVVTLYINAYELASEGNKACYVLEVLADDIKQAYRLGKKDCKKSWESSSHSF